MFQQLTTDAQDRQSDLYVYRKRLSYFKKQIRKFRKNEQDVPHELLEQRSKAHRELMDRRKTHHTLNAIPNADM